MMFLVEHLLRIPYQLCFYPWIIKQVKTFWSKNAVSNGEWVVILGITTRTILEPMRIITQSEYRISCDCNRPAIVIALQL